MKKAQRLTIYKAVLKHLEALHKEKKYNADNQFMCNLIAQETYKHSFAGVNLSVFVEFMQCKPDHAGYVWFDTGDYKKDLESRIETMKKVISLTTTIKTK